VSTPARVAPTDPGPGGAERAVATIDRIEALLERDERLGARVTRPHGLLVAAWRDIEAAAGRAKDPLAVVFVPQRVWTQERELLSPVALRLAEGTALIVLLGRPDDNSLKDAAQRGLASVLDESATGEDIYLAALRAFELMEAKARAEARGRWLGRYQFELGELIDIARAMTTVRDVDQLLGVILEKSRFVTGADAGAIYILESQGPQAVLRFKLTQNDSVRFDSREFTMPLSDRSVAGCAALRKKTLNIADVYDLPTGSTFHFDSTFDRRTGYVTRSMLVAPLISQRDEVIGVIQLINKKRDPSHKLLSKADVDQQVVAFDERSEELLGMLAAQAGVSLETAILYEEIRSLFEGFVKASVEAIESRDPTTSGHSRRVAELTVELARVVGSEVTGPYANASFTQEDLRELEYASLLHDFGKIGVREKVLVKAKKLYPEQLELVRARFDYVARSMEADVLARKIRLLEAGAPRESVEAIDRELVERRAVLDAAWDSVCNANEPTVVSSGDFARIEAIGTETFVDRSGAVRTLLESAEIDCLKINRGSLTPEEFDEIRSHVSHTFRFLSQIPWGKSLRRVPLIAGAHHERLNGTGYPNRLRAEEIPVQAKMMSIADIYDALTASDRPYKRAIPVERAIDILDFSVRDGHLDGELVRIFKDARVWERARERSS
jgi:HD-GYP domain-containing protein (c-di-GMP phosphodiesterase class II)